MLLYVSIEPAQVNSSLGLDQHEQYQALHMCGSTKHYTCPVVPSTTHVRFMNTLVKRTPSINREEHCIQTSLLINSVRLADRAILIPVIEERIRDPDHLQLLSLR